MADRFCPNCGTEVDADARFCPTCGHVLAEDGGGLVMGGDDRLTPTIPPAPAWPPPDVPAAREPEMQPAAARPPDEAVSPRTSPPPGQPPADGEPDLPFTVPGTLSGWLIGAGSGLAALALLPRLADILNVLLFVALLGVAATVFLADRLPRFAYLRLSTLVVVMVALGVALDRSAFTIRGVDTIFLVTVLVAAGGVLLVELDRDRPVPPPGGSS